MEGDSDESKHVLEPRLEVTEEEDKEEVKQIGREFLEKFHELGDRQNAQNKFYKEICKTHTLMQERREIGNHMVDDMSIVIPEGSSRVIKQVIGVICATERILDALDADVDNPEKEWFAKNYPHLLDSNFNSDDSETEQLTKMHQCILKHVEDIYGVHELNTTGKASQRDEQKGPEPSSASSKVKNLCVSIDKVIQRIEEMMQYLNEAMLRDILHENTMLQEMAQAMQPEAKDINESDGPGPSCSTEESPARHKIKLGPGPDSPTEPPHKRKST